ncbi:MAG: hypothetical protein FWF73_04550 [Spirochaetes bacterium]|nr:hypothetical protein [Spirochaetota bacterium]
MTKYLELDHIGIILKEEFMEPFGLSQGFFMRMQNRHEETVEKIKFVRIEK